MFGRLALAIVTLAVIAWQLGFYQWQDITSIISNNLMKESSLKQSDPSSEVPAEKTPPKPAVDQPTRLFTIDELGQYNGKEGSKGLYLAVFGHVFDVAKGERHYGPGGGYEFFAGCDATRAYITGEFNEKGLIADVEGFTPRQMMELETWVEFYKKDYTHLGKLIATFYDSKGEPTEALRKAEEVLEEGRRDKRKEEEQKRRYPPCNSSWNQKEGSKIWCSNKSGGIIRNWAGLPRRYFIPGSSNWQCVCVHDSDLDNPLMKVFEGCGARDISCYLK